MCSRRAINEHDVKLRQMRKSTRKVSRLEWYISRVCEKLAISADAFTRGCKVVVEPSCKKVDRMRESMSADVEEARLSIAKSI